MKRILMHQRLQLIDGNSEIFDEFVVDGKRLIQRERRVDEKKMSERPSGGTIFYKVTERDVDPAAVGYGIIARFRDEGPLVLEASHERPMTLYDDLRKVFSIIENPMHLSPAMTSKVAELAGREFADLTPLLRKEAA